MKPLAMIAALGKNRVLGSNNDLLWHLPDDFKFFKETTMGHVVIMGRKTYESMGKPLPNRTNFIVTRQKELVIEGCHVFSDVRSAITEARRIDTMPFIIGGGEIYSQALPMATEMYLTEVDFSEPGEIYFPNFSKDEWEIISEDFHSVDERHQYSFAIKHYQRRGL